MNRRAFTLLELVLAILLGSIVIAVAAGLFATLDRSQRRQEAKMLQAFEMATAQRTLSRALSTLVMSDQTPPDENELQKKITNTSRIAAGEAESLQVDDDAQVARLSLQHDIRQGGSLRRSAVGGGGGGRPQVLQLALGAPPIAPPPDLTPSGSRTTPTTRSVRSDDERKTLREKLREREEKRRGLNSKPKSASGNPTSTANSPATGPAGGIADPLADPIGEYPRAPGVRAVFELRPDAPDAPGALAARVVSGQILEQGWTLWYRELPPREDDPLPGLNENAAGRARDEDALKKAARERTANLERRSSRSRASSGPDTEAYLDSAPNTRETRLVSGLRSARWTAFRRDQRAQKMTAVWASELPAFLELELETLSGRREKWMFEIGWRDGPEPGQRQTSLADSDPINSFYAQIVAEYLRANGASGQPNPLAGGGGAGGGRTNPPANPATPNGSPPNTQPSITPRSSR